MKIYTRTGDHGKTSLVGGKRVSKCDVRIDSYGTVDELNSFVGLLLTFVQDEEDKQFLLRVQNKLFVVGAYLATDNGYVKDCNDGTGNGDNVSCTAEAMGLRTADVNDIEAAIDRIEGSLPALRAFILPSGSRVASLSHVCRTICRRAERCVCLLEEQGAVVDSMVTSYINRLSDYFFVLARKMNADNGVADVEWHK